MRLCTELCSKPSRQQAMQPAVQPSLEAGVSSLVLVLSHIQKRSRTSTYGFPNVFLLSGGQLRSELGREQTGSLSIISCAAEDAVEARGDVSFAHCRLLPDGTFRWSTLCNKCSKTCLEMFCGILAHFSERMRILSYWQKYHSDCNV